MRGRDVAGGTNVVRCFVKRDIEGVEPSFLQYTECVPRLDAVDEASR